MAKRAMSKTMEMILMVVDLGSVAKLWWYVFVVLFDSGAEVEIETHNVGFYTNNSS